MLEGVLLLWFLLTGLSVAFVAIDIRSTPESPVLKWAFVLITAYTGPVGAFLYVLGCREPLTGLHERYSAARWRQALGSTMHCVAGDGAGILVGAALGSAWRLRPLPHFALEYALGFAFGWTVFQALFMRRMSGSYARALVATFLPEWLSMNALMGGMLVVMAIVMRYVPQSDAPSRPEFWFTMSMALTAGFAVAYPVNDWLVSRHLKHGMMTVRRQEPASSPPRAVATERDHAHPSESGGRPPVASRAGVFAVSAATLLVLGAGVVVRVLARAM